ncbi:FAD-binding domain-containing protein [Thozetella sp. PMI_491]|nr:FAD-binding domain-containing protein [Thozetella sp. PMI_491]
MRGKTALVALSLLGLHCTLMLATDCKCSPDEACWPSESDWGSLNASVSGRLIQTYLPASVCYTDQPNYSDQACEKIMGEWTTMEFHTNDPASIHNPRWADNSCNPIFRNGTSITGDPQAGARGCTFGKYPRYVVNATEAVHVQEAVRFANNNNLRLNVKNTGHSSIRSTAAGSLSIWTHNMKNIEHVKAFQPKCENCMCIDVEPQEALTVGAGVQDDEAFQAASKLNLAVVGGTNYAPNSNQDVGLVGWATGGGHGWLTSEFGMGADNIIQAVVVTPSGDIVMANACQNADLLWAIRGGGGGTFGVITELTVKAYPMPQATTWMVVATKNTTCNSCWWELMANVHAKFPAMKEGGYQGYYMIQGAPSFPTLTFYGLFMLYNKPNGTAENLAEPLLSLLEAAESEGTTSFTTNINYFSSWIGAWNTLPRQGAAGGSGSTTTTRLLTKKSLVQDPAKLAKILELIGPKEESPKGGVSNPSIGGCMSASSAEVDNSLLASWRDTVVHLYTSEGWNDGLPYTQILTTVDGMTNVKGAALRALEPNTGAYFNEADSYEPNWQRSFWGENYEKLLAIKQKYDPNGLQWCFHCVGSELWVQQLDGKLCKA